MLISHQRLITVGLFDNAVLKEAVPISTARKLTVLILMQLGEFDVLNRRKRRKI
jgi:hypothetical protein